MLKANNTLASIYLGDESPEARDCAENYFYFDSKNLKILTLVMHILKAGSKLKAEDVGDELAQAYIRSQLKSLLAKQDAAAT